MEAAQDSSSRVEPIWLCGRPDFLREIFAQVLGDTLGIHQVHDASDIEPPELVVPDARVLACLVRQHAKSGSETA